MSTLAEVVEEHKAIRVAEQDENKSDTRRGRTQVQHDKRYN